MKQSDLTYYPLHTMCGGHSKKSSTVSHPIPPHHHITADNTNPQGEENVSGVFSIPIATRRLLNMTRKETEAVAFLALVRAYEQANNKRCSYTINSLHILTHVHAKTIEKRLLTLEDMGLIAYDENKKIMLKSIRAKHKDHNTSINITLSEKQLKKAEKAIFTARIVNKIRQINFHRDALNRYHELKNKIKGGKMSEIKKLGRWLREHCKQDYQTQDFIDYGWSYTKIAEYLSISVGKAIEIVKSAIENNIIIKKQRKLVMKFSNSTQLDYITHTFTFHGYAFRILANTYDVQTGII